MNSNLLLVSSVQKTTNSTSNTDFKLTYENQNNLAETTAIALKSALIPNVFYNLRAFGNGKHNNIFRYNVIGVGSYTVEIPEGNYTITGLLDTLMSVTTSIGLNAVYSAETGKIYFTTSSPIQFLSEENSNPMARVLGILESSSSTVGVVAYQATGIIDLSGIKEVFVVSQDLTNSTSMNIAGDINIKSGSAAILAHIPIRVAYGFTEHYQSNDENLDLIEYPSQRSGSSLRTLDIKIVDKYGFTLDLKGHDCTFILKVYHNSA